MIDKTPQGAAPRAHSESLRSTARLLAYVLSSSVFAYSKAPGNLAVIHFAGYPKQVSNAATETNFSQELNFDANLSMPLYPHSCCCALLIFKA